MIDNINFIHNFKHFVVAYKASTGHWVTPKGDITVIRVPMRSLTGHDGKKKPFILFNPTMVWLLTGMYHGKPYHFLVQM